MMFEDEIYAGFTFRSFDEEDSRVRRTHLVECIDGLRLYCYVRGPQPKDKAIPVVDVELHGSPSTREKKNPIPSGAERDGVSVVVNVPGRNKGQRRYKIVINSLPVVNNENRLKIAYGLNTSHNCGLKDYTQIRYTPKDSDERSQFVYFCAHDVAAMLFATEYLYNEFGLKVPHQMNPMITPSQKLVEFYTKLNNNCMMHVRSGAQPRNLHKAEKEVLLWKYVKRSGHDNTCLPTPGVKLRDYNWHVR